jgi:hypothetical protein
MIYLASPYTHPDFEVREWRFQEACRATAALLRAGLVVFSPIAHSHPIAKYGMPTNWGFWSRVDREYLSRSDVLAVLTLPGWRASVGVRAEIQIARELGLPIVYITPSELDAGECDLPTLQELVDERLHVRQAA